MSSISNRLGYVVLAGNPNSGKTTLFNTLTGLNQKTGNFPGVTVDKKSSDIHIDGKKVTLIDLPGAYSLYPNSKDEFVVVQTLSNPNWDIYPDLVLYIADINNLERHLLLLTQIIDLGLPVVLLLNMVDLQNPSAIDAQVAAMQQQLHIPVIPTSGRTQFNIKKIKTTIIQKLENAETPKPFSKRTSSEIQLVKEIRSSLTISENTDYQILLWAHHYEKLPFLSTNQKARIAQLVENHGYKALAAQVQETMQRFDIFTPIVRKVQAQTDNKENAFSDRLDAIVTHKIVGPIIFFALMLFVFQAIYTWSGLPMEWIEQGFMWLGRQSRAALPEGWGTDLLVDGILAGLGGVFVFIPQIVILFFLISLLEETGYMARVVYLFDGLMRRFGLSGRSIVALISSGACAIPAVMSTRTISNAKERLITILVTPWISCSARIPVYTILIGFVVPSSMYFVGMKMQGLVFMGLYLLGILGAFVAAFVFKIILKTEERSFLMIELPDYKIPVLRNVLFNVYEKAKTFTLEAGKIILLISVILWFLASYGPPNAMQNAAQQATTMAAQQNMDANETEDFVASKKLEASFAGQFGKAIEPAIQPLGFDWKIGIALLTSFAAREVFVGTMATIYSIGSSEEEATIRQRMAAELRPDTQQPVYTMATALSLLVFYVFAMQCLSTLAVVRRETKSWKWPIVQLVYMTATAFLGSMIVYQLLS